MPSLTSRQVRELREHLGLSVPAFGQALGASWVSVYRWEAGTPPRQGRFYRALLRLYSKHIRGPSSYEEAEATLAVQLDVTPGDAAQLLGRYQRAEGESWSRAVERIVAREERRRSAALGA